MLTFARVRAIAIVTLLVIGAVVAVYLAVTRDTGPATADQQCSEDSVVADLELSDPHEIIINVYNGTDRTNLATQVARDFTVRDFDVREADDDPQDRTVDAVALLRYGPEAVGAAQVLQAYFLNNAAEEFSIDREGDAVDVVIGSRFRQLATQTEVNQSIAALGNAVPPPGTCAGPAEG